MPEREIYVIASHEVARQSRKNIKYLIMSAINKPTYSVIPAQAGIQKKNKKY
jgi:hypothetical protein